MAKRPSRKPKGDAMLTVTDVADDIYSDMIKALDHFAESQANPHQIFEISLHVLARAAAMQPKRERVALMARVHDELTDLVGTYVAEKQG
jgi:hypothetical protein